MSTGRSSWKKLIGAIFKALALYVITYFALQDLLPKCRPSRVSTTCLLPFCVMMQSPAVRQQEQATITTTTSTGSSAKKSGIGEEDGYDNNDGTTVSNVFDAVYVSHGLCASALSWLPAMP